MFVGDGTISFLIEANFCARVSGFAASLLLIARDHCATLLRPQCRGERNLWKRVALASETR